MSDTPQFIPGTKVIDPATVPAKAPAAPAAEATPTAATGPKTLSLLIKPASRDRWTSTIISLYTPQYIETICRGAMSGNLLAQYQMFDLMEQTWPRLSKNFNELKNAVIDLEWNLQPFALKGQKPSKEAQRRARIMEHIIWNMAPDIKANENNFEDTIYDVLDALGKGIAVLEMDIPAEPVRINLGETSETVFPVRATRWVHPRYYGYPGGYGSSDELMLNAKEVRQTNPNATFTATSGTDITGEWMPFPENKFIVSIIKQKSGHPINAGMLRLLGFWWAASNFTWDWFLNFAQIFGMPIRWATYPQNSPLETISLVEQLLQNMGSSAYAAFPEGTMLQILDTVKGSAGDNPQKVLIDAADIICDITILGQTLTTTQGSRGSQSLGNIHKDVRDEKISAIARRASQVLNQQFLKPLCILNFGDDQLCPYFEPAAVQAKDSVAVANKFKTILSIPGVRVSLQQFYEENDLVVPDETDDVIVGQASGGGQQDKSGGEGGAGSGDNLDEGPVTASAKAAHRGCRHNAATARAGDAGDPSTNQIIETALEDLTGVQPRWLGGVLPFFSGLVSKSKSGQVTDADFIAALEKASAEMPELFSRVQPRHLQDVLANAMGAAAANGVAQAHADRKAVAA